MPRRFALGFAVFLTGACAAWAAPVGPIGGTRDAHGCLPAAGYTWCARERQCVRPWEFAARRGIANTAKAFERACRPRKPQR